MARFRNLSQKEPVALLWVVIGCLIMLAWMIGIERLVPRY
jgi:hypothetical protein